MKNKRNILASVCFVSMLLLASCGSGEYGENADMPPESQTGNTQETGMEGSGDLPGTGANDTSEYVNEVIGDDNAAASDSL